MWLINSSVGKKVVMSVTGIALVCFLAFHMCMNCVALFSEPSYNAVCKFLGANWYALVASAILGLLVLIHFVYAFWLTMLNRKARGTQRYEVTEKPKSVEWASQNMFVLGLIVIGGLLLHLCNFWMKMQLNEIIKIYPNVDPTDGVALIKETFGTWWLALLYIVWLCALWFHLTHGFWSALQTLGWSNQTWFARWRVIGNICVTLLVLGFVAVIAAFFFQGVCGCGASC